jgi:cytochrome c6
MRHVFTTRAVIAMAVILVVAAAAFALLAREDATDEDPLERILALEIDLESGRAVYTEIAQPTCASCHSLADAGAVSDRASDLDVMAPTAEQTILSIIAGTIGAHEAQDYRTELSDQQIADVAAYVEEATGS